MKVLLASSSSGSHGGGEIFLLYLGEGLATAGCQPILWASDNPRLGDLARGFAAIGKVVRARYTNTYDRKWRSMDVLFSSLRAHRIAQEWRALGADLVHVNKQNLEDGLDLLRAANRSGLPTLATIHLTQSAQFLGARAAWLRDAISRRELRRFRGDLIGIQEPRAEDLRRVTGRSFGIHAIPNGVRDFGSVVSNFDRKKIRATTGCTDAHLVFVCVARLTAQKDPMGFLDTAVRIAKRYEHARFIWVGDGDWQQRWDQAVATRGMGNVVRQIGWQTDVRPWLHGADVYLHVAKFESFLPLSVLEAMSARLPVIIGDALASDIPLLREMDPFLLTATSSTNIDLSVASERELWGQRGRKVFEEHFSLSAMARRYMHIYSALLTKRFQ
jgi:glycosyltransferase involved in cell wall biosynthesis